jgi:choline-glycine betaine transporter
MGSLISWINGETFKYVIQVMAIPTLIVVIVCVCAVWKDARARKKNRLPFKAGIK